MEHQLVKKFPAFHGNPMVHHRVHKSSPPQPIMIQSDSVHTLTHNLLKIYFNIIPQSSVLFCSYYLTEDL
jgi:hypothetical protein